MNILIIHITVEAALPGMGEGSKTLGLSSRFIIILILLGER